jgi:molybdopterin-biosynthesis enzyme MoeA-like protein
MLTSQRIDHQFAVHHRSVERPGVEVRRKLIIGDDRALLTAAVRDALQHARS